MKYRKTTADDLGKLNEWVAADVAHKDLITGAFFVPAKKEENDKPAETLSFHVTKLRAPDGIASIGLGVHDAADQWIDEHKVMAWTDPVTAIREAIAHQASSTPEFVSLPIFMVSIDHQGVHSLN